VPNINGWIEKIGFGSKVITICVRVCPETTRRYIFGDWASEHLVRDRFLVEETNVFEVYW